MALLLCRLTVGAGRRLVDRSVAWLLVVNRWLNLVLGRWCRISIRLRRLVLNLPTCVRWVVRLCIGRVASYRVVMMIGRLFVLALGLSSRMFPLACLVILYLNVSS